MKILNKLFKIKLVDNNDPYSLIGAVGLSHEHLRKYEESVKKIKEYEFDKAGSVRN
jgi:hypothetical protein